MFVNIVIFLTFIFHKVM